MDCIYNDHVSLMDLLSEILPGVGRASLCVRTQCRGFDRGEEVQI